MPKKIPMRQCLGCREMKPKKELIRVVRSPEGEVSLDFKGKKPGRGAYVCPSPECLKKARKATELPSIKSNFFLFIVIPCKIKTVKIPICILTVFASSLIIADCKIKLNTVPIQ